MNLGDLETLLIPEKIKVNILGEESKYFYIDMNTGEYKEDNGTKDMYDMYREYQLDRIYEADGEAVTIDIRWRSDLYKKD